MKVPCVVIGGGLSGLAAAIRLARFIPDVVLLEKHTRIGGLNSYYYRNKTLFETGLHAITNYAEPGDKRAPLNRLLRQLKLKRKDFTFLEQKTSEILFSGRQNLLFSNDFSLLETEIAGKFPHSIDSFRNLVRFLDTYDPFKAAGFSSARSLLAAELKDPLLVDMLLCPLMYYGSSVENDMDLSQFAIMFQAVYREGMFRPEGTIKDFLDFLLGYYHKLGGTIRLGCGVRRIARTGRTESIFQLPTDAAAGLPRDRTIIFFNTADTFRYQQPEEPVDYRSGVICMPFNFQNLVPGDHIEVRSTHLASYSRWKALEGNPKRYLEVKAESRLQSLALLEKMVGKFSQNIVYEDTFTPLTIERYTAKKAGAIYGSPLKVKDGDLGFANLFLAGTDQGFLGIVGSMLSGVSIANQHILSRF